MSKPDGQIDIFFRPECLPACDTRMLSVLSLMDKKTPIKAMAKLCDQRLHAISGSHARAALQEEGSAGEDSNW